ncbi:cation-translocating P-type ATPase [Aquifex pyrophilus]
MKKSFKVSGMSCVNCARNIEIALKKTKGVKGVNVSFELGRVYVEWDENLISEEEIIAKIRELGYGVEERKSNKELYLLLFSFFASSGIALSMFLKLPLEIPLVLSTLVQFTAGLKFYRGALSSLRQGVGSMDTLVALGTTGAYLYSLLAYLGFLGTSPFFETNAFLITFVRLGKFIEEKARERATSGLKKLLTASLGKVKVLEGNREVEKNALEVMRGEKVVYRKGDQILLDGVVLEGEALVNESVLTGESTPVLKKKGDEVLSGSILEEGFLITEVKRSFESSFINKVRKLVEEALKEKPRIQRISDRVAHYFVIFVVLLSVLVFTLWYYATGDIQKAVQFSLAVLVVSCPCAFGIAVPLAVSVGIFKALRKGIILKKSSVIEVFPKVNTIVFDKTGTLTEGRFKVEKVEVYEDSAFDIAYSLEEFSNHPVAKAIRDYLRDKVKERVRLENCKEVLGVGVECGEYKITKGEVLGISSNGYNVVALSKNEKPLAVFYLRDRVREESREVVSKLKELGLEIVLLTGDKREKAISLAKELGIDRVIAEVKPDEKLKVIEELQRKGRVVCMVGDGVNDAPALARSDVGVAVSEGSDIAKISGDVIIHRLRALLQAYELSRKVYGKIKENLFWAFIYNALFIPVASGVFHHKGLYLKPEYAGLLMALSSVSVVLNTLRLLR